MSPTAKKSIRDTARWVWVCLLFASGAIRMARRELSRKRAIIVLTLHRVLPAELIARTNSLPGMCIRQGTFSDMLHHIVQRYVVVDLARVSAPPGGPVRAELRIALTFDDGWLDTAHYAAPALRNLGVTATVFVCPDLLGRPLPFWPERVLAALREKGIRLNADKAEALIEKLKCISRPRRDRLVRRLTRPAGSDQPPPSSAGVDAAMDWSDVKRMAASGLVIGSHTCTHQILTQLPPVEAGAELAVSKTAIEEVLNSECKALSYPNGDSSAAVRQMARLAGYELGFTTGPGAWTAETDPLAVPRCNISEENVVDLKGRFSRLMFGYAAIWKSYCALRLRQKAARDPGTQRCDAPAPVKRTLC